MMLVFPQPGRDINILHRDFSRLDLPEGPTMAANWPFSICNCQYHCKCGGDSALTVIFKPLSTGTFLVGYLNPTSCNSTLTPLSASSTVLKFNAAPGPSGRSGTLIAWILFAAAAASAISSNLLVAHLEFGVKQLTRSKAKPLAGPYSTLYDSYIQILKDLPLAYSPAQPLYIQPLDHSQQQSV